MDEPGTDWNFADGWVFAAIASNRARCSLADLIASADWINHAILNGRELEDALGRLTGAGLVRVFEDWTFELTDDGTTLWPGGRDPLAAVEALLPALSDFEAGRTKVRLPRGAMAAAVENYLDGASTKVVDA
jgi:hypothetical protein